MTIGTGIATAGWLLAFVWGCSVSDNTAVSVVIFGVIIVAVRYLSRLPDDDLIEMMRRKTPK